MNDFVLYEQLRILERIGQQYPEGIPFSGRVRAITEQLTSQTYRVAVIGEFKRGKSSLVNALLGSSVLPTSILPATAAISRVIYGERERIVVHYKDGRTEERSAAQLQEFATKLDAQKEATARTIREIQVYYPSVFCKNHIEVLDTPGINDNEEMDAVTLSVLGEVDAAIFVMSPGSPLSVSEQNLILALIDQPGIRHIIFVLTCIDRVSDDPEEQERLVDNVRTRIAENALQSALDRFEGSPELLEKSRRILASPHIYGVSALLALKGFVRDDEKMLKESRFPAFKDRLLAYLTAAQGTDTAAKAVEAGEEAARSLEGWYKSREQGLKAQVEGLESALHAREEYQNTAQVQLTMLFQRMDLAMERRGITADGILARAQVEARKPFITRLSGLKAREATHENILQALREGRETTSGAIDGACLTMHGWIAEEMAKAESALNGMRERAGYAPAPFLNNVHQWRERTPFPAFQWTEDPIQTGNLLGADVMVQVNKAVRASLAQLGKAINDYVASWRLVLLRQAAEDRKDTAFTQEMSDDLDLHRRALSTLETDYRRHQQEIEAVRRVLRAEG